MTEPDVPAGLDLSRGAADLAAATRQLRDVPPTTRSVEIADRVLQATLAVPRRSVLVRAAPPHEFVRVSSLVITAVLRERLDTALVGAAVRRVLLDVDRDEQLLGLTIELIVQFGTVVVDVADEARALTLTILRDLLGGTDHAVAPGHVHVSDVTVGDPHLVDPTDE